MAESIDAEFLDDLKMLGSKIRQVRVERGLSVRDMVVRHNYHDAQWRRYEKGAALTVPSLLRIAKALGTSVAILLDGVGEYSISKVDDIKDTLASAKGIPGKKEV